MKLSTMTFEHNTDFLRWQERDDHKIFSVNMVAIPPDETTPFQSQSKKVRYTICVVYYLEE